MPRDPLGILVYVLVLLVVFILLMNLLDRV